MVTEAASLKKIAEGREAEMFEWDGGRVLRLYRGGEGQSASLDSQKMALARSCGVRVPEDYGMTNVDGRTGIIIERIKGPDLLTEINTPGACGRSVVSGDACRRTFIHGKHPRNSGR